MKIGVRHITAAFIGLSLISITTLVVIFNMVQRATEGLEERYAAMQFAYILANHIVESDGEWPRSWDEFQLAFDRSVNAEDQTYAAWRATIEPFIVIE